MNPSHRLPATVLLAAALAFACAPYGLAETMLAPAAPPDATKTDAAQADTTKADTTKADMTKADPGYGNSAAAPAAKPALSYLGTVECAAKFHAAKLTGKLGGRKWNEFRAAECGPQPSRAALETTAPVPNSAPLPASTAAPPAAEAVFPAAIDPKYAKEFSDKGRMRTCADQFNLNKAGNANGGMKWIDKGGGYYAECNRRLKGA